VFLSVFLSVAYAPREALTGWLRHISNVNPVTYLIEASRAAELSYLGWDELWKGAAAVAIMVGLLGAWALKGLSGLARR
jgi:ABC-2 type transport system permease protein